MQLTQSIRRVTLSARQAMRGMSHQIRSGEGPLSLTGIAVGAVALAVLIGCYYLIGAIVVHRIDDDLAFAPAAERQEGQSAVLLLSAALLDRELNENGWVLNDPPYLPSSLLDNMPNFQAGLKEAIATVAAHLQTRAAAGGAGADKDLTEALEKLGPTPDQWIASPANPLSFGISSERNTRSALRLLDSLNKRMAAGEVGLAADQATLNAVLGAVSDDLAALARAIDGHLEGEAGFFWHGLADDKFYRIKGRLYGLALLLDALKRDFEAGIGSASVAADYDRLVDRLNRGASLRPLIVFNGRPGASFVPCHLCGLGLEIAEARQALDGIRQAEAR